jgi:hypothetical protein
MFYDRLEFTKRNLTRKEDILNAFRGILQKSSFITFWGVPVIRQNSNIDPNTGFALGHLWIKRPHWTIPSHIRGQGTVVSARRDGFPTWSWTSLIADIYQDNYGPQSSYTQYLNDVNGGDVKFPHNEAQIRFWLHIDCEWTSLLDVNKTDYSTLLPEHSQQLLVEGEFIHLRYKYRGIRHRWYHLFDQWRYFQPDLMSVDHEWPGEASENDPNAEEYTLVLIQWNESQPHNKKRLLLMLLEWIDDKHAQRKGLLTSYRDEFLADRIDQMPRIRKRFILQ